MTNNTYYTELIQQNGKKCVEQLALPHYNKLA